MNEIFKPATESLWTENTAQFDYPQLKGRKSVDVAIIGGGMTGLTAALLLKKAGKSVAVVEMHHVGTGESGHTTAHLTELIDTGYSQLVSDFGVSGAKTAASSGRAAIELIALLSESLDIDCDFERVPAYLYSEDRSGVSKLKKELKSLKKVGIRADYQKDIPLPFPIKGAVRIDDQAQFHPYRYMRGLASAIHGKGSFVFENSIVREVKEEKNSCTVRTDAGEITATDVIVATNSPSFCRMTLHTKISAYRTYAMAVEVDADLSGKLRNVKGLFYDTADPYHYIRSQKIDKINYWIIGGEDHKVGMEEDTDQRFAQLEAYSQERFDIKSVDYRWSGQIIEPMDGLPFIGLNPGSSHQYLATGYSGNGMTFGTVAGMLCSDLILGVKNPWSELYDPGRIHAKASAATFLSENKDFPICFIKDRVAAPEATSLGEVSPGEGKIIKVNGKTAAVYRNLAGEVQAVSPVCTHMGCYVRFNDSEKSWDCPCHGSRFGTDGEVLNGPAKKDLQPVSLEELSEAGAERKKRSDAA
ncbi:MAG: FAD-dependent oxidoreductase [Methylotenera sp.]|nr:FAD-dependent oxidoreductase [Oligoflexia bacterium]